MKPITKRLVPLVLCLPVAAAMLSAPPAHAAHGAIVRVTLTSVWATPSPDPMGITYDPRTQRLLISDSEVDEMPGLWKGRNLFVVKRKGNLASSRTLKKFTVEPEDLAMDNRHRSLFVTDDDLDRVFKDKAGKDGLFGTRDDVAVTRPSHAPVRVLRPRGADVAAPEEDADRVRLHHSADLQDPTGEGPEVRHAR